MLSIYQKITISNWQHYHRHNNWCEFIKFSIICGYRSSFQLDNNAKQNIQSQMNIIEESWECMMVATSSPSSIFWPQAIVSAVSYQSLRDNSGISEHWIQQKPRTSLQWLEIKLTCHLVQTLTGLESPWLCTCFGDRERRKPMRDAILYSNTATKFFATDQNVVMSTSLFLC